MTITQRLQPLLEYNTSKDYSHAPTTGWTTLAGLDWLEGVSFKMGRGDEQSAVTPSTISFVLDNIDGKYTPGNTSSTFYPNADTGLWVRFRLTDGTTTWPIFTGLTDSFIPTVAGPNAYKKVDVACSDILSRWTRFRGIKSCLHEEILLDAPLAYYPLDEGAGAQSFADVSGSVQPPLQVMSIGATGTLEPGGTTGPPGAGEQAPNFNPDYTSSAALGLDTGYGKYLLTNLKTPLVVGNGHAYTMEWWFKINNAGATADTPGANPFYPGLMMLDLTDPDTFYGGFYQTVGAIRPPASGGPYGRYGSNSQKLCILGSRLTTT
ncbi:MAG: hypothetical protein ACRDU4_00455, partial [Mycobacterium sp.]